MKETHFKKIASIIRIIRELDHGEMSSNELAAELEVSVRSIQRYIKAIEEAQIPIVSLGNGRYKFDDFSLKAVKASKEEAALLVFLSEITKQLGKSFTNSFDSMCKKILYPDKESPFYIKMPKTKGYERTEVVRRIEEAVENNNVIDIEFKAFDGKIKRCTLQPYKIINFEGFWYLYALKKGQKRTFKLENIKNCEVTGKIFTPKKSILKSLDESVNVWFSNDKKIKVRLSVDKEVTEFFKVKEYFPNQKIIKTQKNGDLVLETTIGRYEEITPTIFSWIPFIKVINSKDINKIIRGKLSKFLNRLVK
jgi:Predicted transcriptional regulator